MRIFTQVVATLIFGALGMAHADDLNQTFPAGPIKNIILKHTEGSVTITGKGTDTISVQAKKRAGDNSCITRATVSGATLEIKTDKSMLGRITCQVDVTITMPKQTSIEADMGAGKVALSGVGGGLTFNLGAGAITGDLDARTSKIKIGTGQLKLSWNQLPASGSFDFEVGTGEVDLNFPKGAVINSNITKGMATLSTQVKTSPDAKFKVAGKLGFGSVSVQ